MQIYCCDDHPFDVFVVLLGFVFSNQYYFIIISTKKHTVDLSVLLPLNYCIVPRVVIDIRPSSASDKVG